MIKMTLDIQNISKLPIPTGDVEPQQKQEVKAVAAASVTPEVSQVRSVETGTQLSSSAIQSTDKNQTANKPDVHDVIKEMNHAVQNVRRELEFSVDNDSGRTVVKVMNSETGEVIRQLPTEEALAVARKLEEYMETRGSVGADGKSQDGVQGFIMEIRA